MQHEDIPTPVDMVEVGFEVMVMVGRDGMGWGEEVVVIVVVTVEEVVVAVVVIKLRGTSS